MQSELISLREDIEDLQNSPLCEVVLGPTIGGPRTSSTEARSLSHGGGLRSFLDLLFSSLVKEASCLDLFCLQHLCILLA